MLKSEYRKNILKLLRVFKYIPNNPRLIVRAYPNFKNEKSFDYAVRKLIQLGYVERIALGEECVGHQKDTITITKKGQTLANKLDFPKNEKAESRRREGDKELQRRISELEIYMRAELGKEKYKVLNLEYINRDTIFEALKTKASYGNQYAGARLHGVLLTRETVIPVYHIGVRNISVVSETENLTYNDFCSNVLNREVATDGPKKTLLYAKDERVLDRLFLENPWNAGKESGRNLIYNKSCYNKETYIVFQNTEGLVELARYSDAKTAIKEYIDKHSSSDVKVKRKYKSLSAYETEDKIVIDIVQQELYKLQRMKKLFEGVKKGETKEKRKFLICGVPQNKGVFDKLFSEYDFVEFKELEYSEVLDEIIEHEYDII